MSNQPQFLEKPLPSSPDAERVILGAILLDNALCAQAAETLAAEDFYSPRNAIVFGAMLELFERGERIDPILIGVEIEKSGGGKTFVGDVSAIANLTYGLPRFSDLTDYIKLVSGASVVRAVIRAASEIQTFALAEGETVEAITSFAESKIFDVCAARSASVPEPIAGLAFASIEKTKLIIEKGEKVTGLTTGFIDLDKMTGGWKRTDLIIVAGRPSMGKSAIVSEFAANAAAEVPGAVVAVFSLEMSKEQLAARFICSKARIDLHRYLNGYAAPEEMTRAYDAAADLAKTKIIVDDTPGIAPVQMLAKSRRIYAEHKRLDLIVVDYLQLMSGSRRSENRQQEVSAISRELKAIAKQLNVPLIALSQLSRAPEARNPPRPLMSDLRESGSIEQDADVVAFIYRDDYYKPSEENAGIAELIFTKQRNGPTGTVKLSFLKEFTRFENYFDSSDYSRPLYRSREEN